MGNQAQAPSGVTQEVRIVTTCVKCHQPGKLVRDWVSKIATGRCSLGCPLPGAYPNCRPSAGKQVFSINHFVCTNKAQWVTRISSWWEPSRNLSFQMPTFSRIAVSFCSVNSSLHRWVEKRLYPPCPADFPGLRDQKTTTNPRLCRVLLKAGGVWVSPLHSQGYLYIYIQSLYDFHYSKYLIQGELYRICLFVAGLRFIHAVTCIRISVLLRMNNILFYVYLCYFAIYFYMA